MDEPTDAGAPIAGEHGRLQLLEQAVEVWKSQLVDFGGRNTLLYYKDLKQGTLDLTNAPPNALGPLLSGRPVSLGHLVSFPEDLPVAAKRARTIRAKATDNFEERGLRTLFLAWGMATWTNTRGTATPAAPLLLSELTLKPRGGAAEDFDLDITGDWEVNPTLLRILEVDHGVKVDVDALDDAADEGGLDAVQRALGVAAAGITGWATTPRVVVGNFSYAKLPLVRDLEQALASGELATSDMIAAIAGDEAARATVRERHGEVALDAPDHVNPDEEFLVLDADASQSYVVNAATGRADLVIEGPPGTGKSQTIANLIATLAARGRRVLFVAEKRAAIDAVVNRLRNVGLGNLVLDLHGGVTSRKALAQELAKTLAAAASAPRPDVAADQERLVRRRAELVAHDHALHEPRAPWGVSVYDAQAALLGAPDGVRVETRWTGDALSVLTAEAFQQATTDLDRFAALGGLPLLAGRGPWSSALVSGSIATAEQAQAAQQAVIQLVSTTLPGLAWLDDREAALLDEIHATLEAFEPAIFEPATVGAPLPDLAAALAPAARGGVAGLTARLFNGAARSARKRLKPLWKQGTPSFRAVHAAVQGAADQQARWAATPGVPADVVQAHAAYDRMRADLRALDAARGTNDLERAGIAEIATTVGTLRDDQATLLRIPELHRVHTALRERGLDPFLAAVAARGDDADQAVIALAFAWHASVLDAVAFADPLVGAFDASAHDRAAADFNDADRAHVAAGAARVRRAAAEHATRARDAYPNESEIVEREARKQRRHLPVRDLFQQAPNVLTALKPCWAMSPLAVAQLLPSGHRFDVVVFDEASQITPADAVGALLRGERAVVAGDTRQLPPTRFFATSGEDESEELDTESLALTRDLESVLDVMATLLPPPHGTRTLGWHYRSRDERLIAFSNAQPTLYDWSLVTFPGVAGGACPTQVLVPHRSVSDDTESSADEVTRVVELILEHARTRPDESLGVIAMGIKHADRITETLRLARAESGELDAYFERGPADRPEPEPVFIKNLERVQGDERDAIILSVGYGKNADGRMQYRFGPINQDGGERRLNVAITRARKRMTVVSSFGAVDMDPARLNAEGAQMLMRYLAYAESGGNDLGSVAHDKPPLNAFERDVRDRLTAAGIPLVEQFGRSGRWIDFAAHHPTDPARMVMAFEADGASYHSAPTARDRDRLRQEHLQRLGWSFHRIWSTDWFRQRDREVERARAAYDAAVTASDASPVTTVTPIVTPVAPVPPVATAPLEPARGPRPRVPRDLPIDEYSADQLVALTRWIESDTLLRTEDELFAELMTELGFERRGPRIVAALTAAIHAARAR